MTSFVNGQMTRSFEFFLTNVALKWSFASVNPPMDIKFEFPAKTFVTYTTANWLDTGMNLSMFHHVTVVAKCLVTNITFEWFLSRMHFLVISQAAPSLEFFRANSTLIRRFSSVNPFMGFQFFYSIELLLTNTATEWFHTSMTLLM